MLEDKLSVAQRIRLEGFAQACNAAQFKGEPSVLEHLLEEAADIATFVVGDTATLEKTGVLIPKTLLGKKIYFDGAYLRCNETGHCHGKVLMTSNITTFDEILSMIIEHFE